MKRTRRSTLAGGVTGSRTEARNNRKLQLIISNTHSVEPGLTLIQQMELKLDETMTKRTEMKEDHDRKVAADEADDGTAHWSDELEDEYLDAMLRNEGKVQGMLVMLGIMRSTNMKTELQRSKARLHHGVKPHSTEN